MDGRNLILFTEVTADAVPALFSELSIVAAILTAVVGVVTFILKLGQEKREFRRKQADSARNIVDALYANHLAMDALNMLDYEALNYRDLSRQRNVHLTRKDVINGLRISATATLTADDLYVRDTFDTLLTKFEQILSLLDVDFICWEDISSLVGYYIFLVRRDHELRDALLAYSRSYGFPQIISMVNDEKRFSVVAFRGAQDVMGEERPPDQTVRHLTDG